MTVPATGDGRAAVGVVEGLLDRLALVNSTSADGAAAVGCAIVSLGNWLRLHPGEPAGELIAEWLGEQNHRMPLKRE